ncbi:TRAP transporter large permease [Oceanobacillus profundus]|uniref:TRAP transporter large permease n=1 Tax=Oceanobacillus TaxID=182709 RepID=UPI00203F0F57|nr:TRAP transporter large permease [Oceanobacillus profundus]MBR3121683.1 TRAP transporter large permease [Oceanobacillus sp.]MCM3399431.1 TRAP transporter large permease [Oceanobacillus profundus]MDO6450474.1 TRAP transporter large permease [Oceanobacillus profundus]
MAALLFSSLIGLLLLNVPLAIAVGLASILVLYLGDLDLFVAVQRMITGLDVFSLMAIPLFMIAGKIMEIGGISKRLVDLAASIVGSITGGFAIIAVISSMFFAAISGSAPATVVAIGSILVPAMIKEGYDKKFSIALIAASGTIGIIIPPSIPFITFGISANASVGDLFIAGVLPGLLMGLTLIIYCFIISKRKGYKGSEKTSIKKFFQSLKSSILGLLMPLIILGGIYLGWFTPTESGAVACIYGLIVSLFIYRTMKISELKSVFVEAGTLSAMVLFIVATANLMSWLITVEQIPSKIAGALSSVTESPLVFLFIITLVLLVVGTFMETNAAIILIVPILLPLLNTYDINLIHFGVLMIFNLAIGLLTPPLGVNLFVAKSLANIQFNQLIKSIIPFILLMLLNLVILIIIPEISLLLLSE